MQVPGAHGGDAVEGGLAHEPAALYVNTTARSGAERFDQARDTLAALGLELVDAQATEDPALLLRQVRASLEAGVRRLIVGGGDGTLSAVAGLIAGRDVRLGVLPLGTGNDFARSVRIPLRLEAACDVAARGTVRRIDLGVANGRLFLNAASVGLSSAITRRLSDEMKRRLGRAAFAVVAASEAWTHRPFEIGLCIDGGDEEVLEVHQVVVANGRYHGGGQLVSPGASHEDAALDVYVIRSVQGADEAAPDTRARLQDLWNLFRVGTLLRKGRHVEHPAVMHLRAARVSLRAAPEQEVDVDGELLGTTPVEFGVRPRSLQVLVPPVR